MQRLYPRPQMQRDEWINLNGDWDFDFDDLQLGKSEKWFESHDFSKKIVVPFVYQSKLSGIDDQSIHDYIWYHRSFTVEKHLNRKVILHFEAVDYYTEVYVNAKLIGTHTGGSTPFSFDITNDLLETPSQELTLYVYDPSLNSFISRGKQTWREEPFECFYHRSSGIWQTVWIEQVSESAIENLKMTPDIDHSLIEIEGNTFDTRNKNIEISVLFKDELLSKHQLSASKEFKISIPLDREHLFLWSPETPFLYDVIVSVYTSENVVDQVKSYFGMRKISINQHQIMLNNKPYYLRLILDQGYYRQGLVSYPTEEDLLKDITISKKMGFNGCRKHEKIEARRFMYYADKEGYLVSLEMPSQYSFRPSDDFVNEWLSAMKRDYNHPSLFMYVPFNESWGIRKIKTDSQIQDYSTAFYYLTKSFDPTRLVSTNDGWEQTKSDLCTIHTYRHGEINDHPQHQVFRESLTDLNILLSSIHTNYDRPIYVGGYAYEGEPIILSEFGGVSFANINQAGWGYTGVQNENDYEHELKRIFKSVYESNHLFGFCYTQLTDVEQEINGLLDYDRKEKISIDIIRQIVMNE